MFLAEQVLCRADPQAEKWGRADDVVVRLDAELMPGIDHGEEREVGVWDRGECGARARGGGRGEGVFLEDLIAEEKLARGGVFGAKDKLACGAHAAFEFGGVAGDHELEEVSDRACELLDLGAGGGVEHGEAGVDVPFVRVDAQGDVYFYVFDAGGPARGFPGKLAVSVPGGAHAEEGGVGDGLGVGGDAVVFGGGEVHDFGVEAGEDFFDEGEGCGGAFVANDDLVECQSLTGAG